MDGIIEFIRQFNPVVQALIATVFTWLVTALGAALVFFFKRFNRRALDTLFGFAGGVMIAASYWSLLAPAIAMSEGQGVPNWFPAAAGFLLGALLISLTDKILPHLHIHKKMSEAEGIPTKWKKSSLLVLAITLHNIPEGLAVGVAFGGAAAGIPEATIGGAVVLALGIGLQNFPEGIAVAMPLRRDGMSRLRSFWFGQLSAVVEPIAGVIGAAAVLWVRPMLPYALAFAAGAMIFVVVEEVIPESQSQEKNTDLATLGVIVGFTVMMVLDVAFG